jgi:hypothetical protein
MYRFHLIPLRAILVASEFFLRVGFRVEKIACMADFVFLGFGLKYCDNKCMTGADS